MSLPSNLKYTKDHEWISIDGEIAIVGITAYAAEQLGDIVFVDINTVGETLACEEVFGTIEAVKTVSDMFMPIEAEVLEFNDALNNEPELINKDPYGEGWIIKVTIADVSKISALLNAEQYKALVEA